MKPQKANPRRQRKDAAEVITWKSVAGQTAERELSIRFPRIKAPRPSLSFRFDPPGAAIGGQTPVWLRRAGKPRRP